MGGGGVYNKGGYSNNVLTFFLKYVFLKGQKIHTALRVFKSIRVMRNFGIKNGGEVDFVTNYILTRAKKFFILMCTLPPFEMLSISYLQVL